MTTPPTPPAKFIDKHPGLGWLGLIAALVGPLALVWCYNANDPIAIAKREAAIGRAESHAAQAVTFAWRNPGQTFEEPVSRATCRRARARVLNQLPSTDDLVVVRYSDGSRISVRCPDSGSIIAVFRE